MILIFNIEADWKGLLPKQLQCFLTYAGYTYIYTQTYAHENRREKEWRELAGEQGRQERPRAPVNRAQISLQLKS